MPVSAALRSCGDCPIRFNAVCSKCDAGEIAQLERFKSYRMFSAGQILSGRS